MTTKWDKLKAEHHAWNHTKSGDRYIEKLWSEGDKILEAYSDLLDKYGELIMEQYTLKEKADAWDSQTEAILIRSNIEVSDIPLRTAEYYNELIEKSEKWDRLQAEDPDATVILVDLLNDTLYDLDDERTKLEAIEKMVNDELYPALLKVIRVKEILDDE